MNMQGLPGADSLLLGQKSMDALWLRQQVIASNISNDDTPGYKSKTVQFEQLLQDAMGTQSSDMQQMQELISGLEPEVLESGGTQAREDGNNVDIDAENIELVRAQLQYEYMARSITDDISRLKYAITEGKG